MTALFMDGFDHYGITDSRARMLDGVYAEIAVGDQIPIITPAFGARTGNNCLKMERRSGAIAGIVRLVLPAAQSDFIMGFGVYLPQLPANNNPRQIQFRNNGNSTLFSLHYFPDGSIALVNGTDHTDIVVASQGPVLTAGTWHHLEIQLTINASTGVFKVVLDGATTVINGTGLNTGSTNVAMVAFFQHFNNGNAEVCVPHYDDLFIKDTNGSVNNGFSGDARIATLIPDADADLNWTPQYRLNIGNGVLDLRTTNAAVSAADNAEFELADSTYTVEGFVRFHATSLVTRQIIGKWQTASDQREWTIELTGDNDPNPNQLRVLVSTDGAAETVVHTWPWQPLLFHWYHIALVRDGTASYLFLDGTLLGVPRTDSNNYFASSAALAIGARMSSASAVVSGTGVGGMMDEVRITAGVARYTGNFTPTTVPFGRDVGGDASFASVVLLAGFDDGSITDESNSAHTLTARNSAAALEPDGGDGGYTAINQLSPRDDTLIEALLIPAFGIFTGSSNPSDDQTITIDETVYTFKETIGSAYDVHIGDTLADTLDNLVAAINDSGVEGTDYGTSTEAHPTVTALRLPDPQIQVTAITPGTGGNSIDTTGTPGSGAWDAATLENGVSIPDASDFSLSRLPAQTTLVRAIQVVTRAFKTDAGTATIKSTLVGPSDGTDDGADQVLTTDPAYRWDIFETDPDTMGNITPVTLTNGKIRINRES